MPSQLEVDNKTRPKTAGFGEQAVLTAKVLLMTGGVLGLLAVIEWVSAS